MPNNGDMALLAYIPISVSNNVLSVPSNYHDGVIMNTIGKNTLTLQTVVWVHCIAYKADGTAEVTHFSRGSNNVANYDFLVGALYGGGTVRLA